MRFDFLLTMGLVVAVAGAVTDSDADELTFETVRVRPQSRVDAVAYLGDGVVIAGTRKPHSGDIHKSEDHGATWRRVGNITGGEDITCVSSAGDGTGYLLTGQDVHVWRTIDHGDTWRDLGRICHATNPRYANAYGMLVTPAGTVLVADADNRGGHIHRSTNAGESWQDLGAISSRALYRLIEVGDGVIANGWAGHIYKSSDDGTTWRDIGKLIDSDLYAIEYIGQDTVLIGTKSGHIFVSDNNGETWEDRGIVGAAADDFAWLGGRRVLYTTYTDDRSLFVSQDAGSTWTNLGPVPTGVDGDWLDHVIWFPDGSDRIIVGGTNKGFMLHTRLSGE